MLGIVSAPCFSVMPQGSIFVVDDDRLTRESLAELLDDHGFAVSSFPGGLAAWDAICNGSTTPLVVSDVDMPDISGFELLSRSRGIQFSAPFILMSARADDHMRELAEQNGAASLVSKPVAPGPFTSLVSSLIANPGLYPNS